MTVTMTMPMPIKETAQRNKSRPDWSYENAGGIVVCGIDEVGRAPLAGPVMSACAYIPAENRQKNIWNHVNDSKKLTRSKRESLFDEICEYACVSIGEASVEEIDRLNIYHASLLAMRRAYGTMCAHFNLLPELALVDGNASPNIRCKVRTIIKGDMASISIAAASIIAKVKRDRMMTDLHNSFPDYGWNTNAGYPTREHLTGIERSGITNHHRRSFAPVKNWLECNDMYALADPELPLPY